MTRKLGILGVLVASLVLAFGATEASAKGGFGGGKWGKFGIGAGIGLGIGLAAIAARSAAASGCAKQRFVTPDGYIVVRRVCS